MQHVFFTVGIVQFLALSTVALASFSDVHDDHPYAEAIDFVQSQGFVEGYPDGTYRPEAPINRAEFVKILVGSQYSTKEIREYLELFSQQRIPDIPAGAWYSDYVYFGGYSYPDGTFRPANLINYAEAAKIIVRSFGFEVEPGDPWYLPYHKKLDELNVIPLTVRSFEQHITRGEMAEMIHRLETVAPRTKESPSTDTVSGESMKDALEATLQGELPMHNFGMMYSDIHGLWGGLELEVRGDGVVNQRVVRKKEVPVHNISGEEVREIITLLIELEAWNQVVRDRVLQPDESKAILFIQAGTSKSGMWEWYNDLEKNNRLIQIRDLILQLAGA